MSFTALSIEDSLLSILLRMSVNLIVLFILIRVIYYRYSRKDEYLFSFFLMGNIICLLVSLLETVQVQLGMALGLFALFAIIRFRTLNLSTKDMTYFFTVIGVSIINSQANIQPPVLGAVTVNSIIILTAWILELYLKGKTMTSMTIVYNNNKLLVPQMRKELLDDLSLQTGQKIEKIRIEKMSIEKGNAEIEVWFREETGN